MKCYICLVALLFIGTVGGYSAESDTLSKLPLAGGEKLYLHTDKSKYLPGDTIWIRGYLLNSSLDRLSSTAEDFSAISRATVLARAIARGCARR